MRILKYFVWLLGAVALWSLHHFLGFNNGSGPIQFVDGAILAYGAGEYIEKQAHLKVMHQRIEHLHEKFDTHIKRGD